MVYYVVKLTGVFVSRHESDYLQYNIIWAYIILRSAYTAIVNPFSFQSSTLSSFWLRGSFAIILLCHRYNILYDYDYDYYFNTHACDVYTYTKGTTSRRFVAGLTSESDNNNNNLFLNNDSWCVLRVYT